MGKPWKYFLNYFLDFQSWNARKSVLNYQIYWVPKDLQSFVSLEFQNTQDKYKDNDKIDSKKRANTFMGAICE